MSEYEEFVRLQEILLEKKAELKTWRRDTENAVNQSKKSARHIANVWDKIAFVKQECGVFYDGIKKAEAEVEEYQRQSDIAWEAYEQA